MTEDMRGLFVILKGQYRQKREPHFFNEVSEENNFIGGYDPEREDTEEWYMLYDTETLTCCGCSSDFEKVVKGVKTVILKYRTRERYIDTMRSLDRPRSPIHECLMREIIHVYGDYFASEIEEQEDEAYEVLRQNTTQLRGKKKLKTRKHIEIEERSTPQEVTPEKEDHHTSKLTPKTETRPAVKKKLKHRNVVLEEQNTED